MSEATASLVVVTGGAGFLGQAVVDGLLRDGHAVVAFDRAASVAPNGAASVVGDIRDRDLVKRVLDGADAVVHAAFAPPQATPAELRQVNVEATGGLAELATGAGVQRLVVVSSTIVERRARTHPVSSRLPLSRLDTYRRTRSEGEVAALAWQGRLDVSLARPSTFLGPGRVGAFALLFEAVRAAGLVPILGPGTNRYQLLHVDDLAAGLVRLATGPHRGVFHFGATGVESVRDQLATLVDHAGTGARVAPVPRSVAVALVRALELAGLPPLSDWHHATARVEDRVSDLTRATDELGWVPAFSNERCLLDAYSWYVRTRAAGLATPTTHPVPLSHRVAARGLATARRVRR